MKRFLQALSVLCLLCILLPARAAAAAPSVMIDGVPVAFPDAQPYVDDQNRTMVPLRAVAEGLTCQIEWSPSARVVRVTQEYGIEHPEISYLSVQIYLKQDTPYLALAVQSYDLAQQPYQNEARAFLLDTNTVVRDGRTYLPIRAVAELLGCTVGWDASNQAVTIGAYEGALLQTTGASVASEAQQSAVLALIGTQGFETGTSEPPEPVQPEVVPEEKPSESDDMLDEVLRLVNEARAAEGLGALSMTDSLQEAAAVRAAELPEFFDHTRPDGSTCFTALDEAGISYRAAGENIAYGYGTAEAVVEGWMNSPGHRANILNGNFGHIGIGCYSENGTLYWVQLFTD